MVKRNSNFIGFQKSYLFVEIAKRREKYQQNFPNAKIISLGIGDTTEPITPTVIHGFEHQVHNLSTVEGYTGYPEFNGSETLRKLIADEFYKGTGITSDEIFISDGSKPDLARLQLMFSPETTVAVQNPVYPVYVDTSVISGKAGEFDENTCQYKKLVYMPCTPENHFFPNLDQVRKTDLIFWCSPNNPTGVASTKAQLTKLVEFAKKNKSIIIYDSAYSSFITSADCPKSIFEIEGAHQVAFETSSFSKRLGFTGVRLGWTVCPKGLCYSDGTTVHNDWARIMGTCFNGASSISEQGATASLSVLGKIEMENLCNYYMNNAKMIYDAFTKLELECYGGTNCPYVWIKIPNSSSWDMFQKLLDKAQVIVTPGAGFGKEGNNFIRVSGFAHVEDVKEALTRLTKLLGD